MSLRHCIVIPAFLCFILLGTVARLRAESSLCAWGGYAALHEAIAVYADPPAALGGQAQKGQAVRHATLRAMLAIKRCPVTAEKALSADPKATRLWESSIQQILEPYSSNELSATNLSELAHGMACMASTPFVCGIREQLRGRSTGIGRPRRSDTCLSLGTTLMTETTADFKRATGDFVTPMGDLAFLLSTCPDSFFKYMNGHQVELDAWLQDAQSSLFWGEPKDEAILRAYKTELIGLVERKATAYAVEKKKILKCLREAPVRVTQ